MSLRIEIERSPETLSDMDAACALRWREGDHLLNEGDFDGAVYLLGYVIEMRLKLAAFRRGGARASDLVHTLRRNLQRWMRINAPTISDEGGHSLLFWLIYLELTRATSSPSLLTFRGVRRHVIASAYHNWKVEMRYRDTGLEYDDAWRLCTDVWWVEENWPRL